MKKIIWVIAVVFLSNASGAQNALANIAKYYFRSDPFTQEIGSFLQRLINDPTLINTVNLKRTDTSLFYFKGEYKNHNPFFFKAKRTMVVFAEKAVLLNDSLNLLDTIITYQIAGYTSGGKEGLDEVKHEFKKFDRRYIKKFMSNDFTDLKSGDEVYGGIRNYYLDFSYLSPLSIGWQKIGPADENVFVITLRFKISENSAVLPITPDGS